MVLPIVTYEISENKYLKRVRYSLDINKIDSNPLFHIEFVDGYIQNIVDWQCPDFKNTIYPNPKFQNFYIFQDQNKATYCKEGNLDFSEKILIFRGFEDYEVKYIRNVEIENELGKYGFFLPELRNIINNAELLFKYIPTINYHLIKSCNMDCKHCFSDYNELDEDKLPLEQSKQIISEIAKKKFFKKINFSGGEPTLCPKIEELIRFAKEKGLETSMVTNGYNLIKNPTCIDKFSNCLDLLTLSLDGFDEKLNIKIGRFVGKTKETVLFDDIFRLTQKCESLGIKIKVNTVVTKLNYNEIIADKIAELKPIRWKILRILLVKYQNNKAQEFFPTKEEYETFVHHNKPIADKLGIKIITEDNEDMTGSYLMISPDGKFFNNVEGKHSYSEPILEVGIDRALKQTPLRREIFYKRKGDYSVN